ncbi:MAG: M15 family metallopeptidase, partial [Candidatus Parcubacteria bacterium]|nr:M15 family metallopeptidase [Candidatus Parcubacteria bacterium]
MKKHLLSLVYAFFLLTLTLFIFVPYFTTDFFDLRQKKENEEIQKKLAQEELLKKQIEQKIYLMGKFEPVERDDFILIPDEYAIVPNKMYLRKETFLSFRGMQIAAKKEGVDLKIASATRNFDYQKDLWNKKWNGYTLVDGKDLSKSTHDGVERFKKILEYSATPGTSRHHWGTDIDINNANLEYFETIYGKKVYSWLVKNAPSFGFCQVYNLKGENRPTGYNEEKWHWSYLPLAREFTQDYKKLITNSDITGFDGEKYVANFDLLNN